MGHLLTTFLMHIISLASNYYYLILSMILPYSCAASVFLFCHFDYCSAPIHQSVCNKNLSYYCHHILTITYVLSFLFSYTTSQSQKKSKCRVGVSYPNNFP